MQRGFWIFFWIITFSTSALAGTTKRIVYGKNQLVNEIHRLVMAYQNADIGVYIKSMKYGDTLYAQNIHRPFVPASILKILTAESALLYLGPDYRFNTQFVTDAKTIKNGVLGGNLYLIQSGDPSLTYSDLTDLMDSLKTQRVQRIAGNVYIDDSAFDQSYEAPGWTLKDTHSCYGAPISAGIVNHNCLALRVMPGHKPGQLARILTSPHYYYPILQNSIITKAKKSRGCYLKLGSSENSLSLHGCMPKGNYAWGVSYVIQNVLNYNQSLVKSLFKRHGVAVQGEITPGKAIINLSPLVQHQSKPLKTIVTEMMKKSDNIIAGALFKKLGQLYTKKPGSWENGSLAVEKILSSKIGINTANMRIIDGSGISRFNQVTPNQMMQILDFAYHHSSTNQEFFSSLPIAGVDGTLKRRMYNITRKVRAKTGTMHGVISLAGYAASNTKEPIAFVIIINSNRSSGWAYKELEDKIATLITQYQR